MTKNCANPKIQKHKLENIEIMVQQINIVQHEERIHKTSEPGKHDSNVEDMTQI